ncbi:GTP-binding protein REM 1-like [Tachypleus tridentatus]|uniref:GTP-binding protein REM 1-like n=1 Tax=Tachypleus tridentatus TaxID=6853 RepID=UPI003FD3B595
MTFGKATVSSLLTSSPNSDPDLFWTERTEKIWCREMCLGSGISLTEEKDVRSYPSSPNLRSIRRHPNGPVGRSQSMRNARRIRPPDHLRQRNSSIPREESASPPIHHPSPIYPKLLLQQEGDWERLRNFSATSKGVINRGDSFRSKSHSASNISNLEPHQEPARIMGQISLPNTTSASACASENRKYQVLIIGSPDVGKTSLIIQFATSEYISAYEASMEDTDKSVTVVLNGQESELVFLERSFLRTMDMTSILKPDVGACVLVYSVTSRSSFQDTKVIFEQLSKCENFASKSIILVGNKTDLARLRTVSTEAGRTLAMNKECKFIETSADVNHNVDELLVGILSQIRLKAQHQERAVENFEFRPSNSAKWRAKTFIKRMMFKKDVSKSCGNLLIL